jgi:hypothetical protein
LVRASRTVGRSSGCAGSSAAIGDLRRRMKTTVNVNERMGVTTRMIFTLNAGAAVGR